MTTYISEFSPRTLQNFISDPNTHRVLGFFIAGIIYTMLLLLLIQEADTDTVTHFIAPSFTVLFNFSEYLYKYFYQIRQHGFQDISTLSAGLKALRHIAANNSDKIIWQFTEFVIEGIEQESLLPWDKHHINRHLETWPPCAVIVRNLLQYKNVIKEHCL
ncbi:DUF2254 family protein [Alteribacillus sp. JSM 102045]|uniref:DUF2254 family protein n=1 Tax=Alteribacillus sp. JSM 102045 TaxID=1562101 RepID=UPI0035C210E1